MPSCPPSCINGLRCVENFNNNICAPIITFYKDKNFTGGCVTIPHKETVFKWLKRRVTSTSKKIGAVNCLFRDKNGKLKGTNTDGEAALKSFKNKFGNIKNKKIILIGAGGAGKAVASYFISEMSKRKNLIITGRSKSSKKFSKKIGSRWQEHKKISLLNLKNFDAIINCTSLGFGKFINKSPSPYHCVKTAGEILMASG